jgi:general secretion pathway protein F
MKEAARVVLESASEGGGVAAPMARAGVFAPVAVSLVRVGEETAKLEEMLLRAAELCEEEGRRSVDRLLGLVGPGVTVLLGLVVAGVIGSILVAVLNVYELAM